MSRQALTSQPSSDMSRQALSSQPSAGGESALGTMIPDQESRLKALSWLKGPDSIPMAPESVQMVEEKIGEQNFQNFARCENKKLYRDPKN